MVEEIKRARDLALERLLERKNPNGSWEAGLEVSAFLPSIYIIMLRATGLSERKGARQTEADLVRHMINRMNPDGGFCAFKPA